MEQKEEMWLKALEQGEDQAYQELFEDFYAALSGFAFRFVEESAAAEDLVQDTLYELWLRKLHFDNRNALKSYLYLMVRSRCLDYIKHRKVKHKYLAELRQKENSEFFLNQMLEEEIYLLLKKALNTLHGTTREVYELIFQGLDNVRIAEELNLTIDAVKAHKKRGKKLLQEKLRGYIYWLWLRR